MLLFINVVFLENEPLSCLEWLSEPRTTTEQQQIVRNEYFTITQLHQETLSRIQITGESSPIIVQPAWLHVLRSLSASLYLHQGFFLFV